MYEDPHCKGAAKNPVRRQQGEDSRRPSWLSSNIQAAAADETRRMDMFEVRSKYSAYVGRGSNTRLQWQKGTPVRAAGCETDEQESSVFGLAAERRCLEIVDLGNRGRCRYEGDAIWVVLSSPFVGESADTATPLWVRLKSAYNPRLAPF
jgi:hypothetical protein